MTFHTRETYSIGIDTKADTDTWLQHPSSTSPHIVVNLHDDENNNGCCEHSEHRCQHFGRQLTTPTKFSIHDDAVEWLKDFEDISRANNWNAKDKFDIVRIYFADKSTKTWFRETEDEFGNDFENFKLAFLTRFSKGSKDKAVEMEVEKRRKGQKLKGCLQLIFVLLIGGSPLYILLFFLLRSRY